MDVFNENSNITPLLKRVFMFLEDGEWDAADKYCERVLDIDPENASAYLGKLMSEMRVRKQEDLKDCNNPFNESNNYKKVIRFANEDLKTILAGYIEFINICNENERLSKIYASASALMKARKYTQAKKEFENIVEYKDAKELIEKCVEKFKQEKIVAEKKAKQIKKIAKIMLPTIAAIVAVVVILTTVIIPNSKYTKAISLMNSGKYEEAISIFETLEGYKDSESNILESKYGAALVLINEGKYIEAVAALEALNDYKDSREKASSIFYEYRFEKTKHKLKTAEKGDCVTFGAYEQDNNISNRKEEIEWIVLDKTDSQMLVISKCILEYKQYNAIETSVTWETSDIRKWLNNEFINSAIIGAEKSLISAMTVSADVNPYYNTNIGNETQDQIFLLSIIEANEYFASNSEMECGTTEYAVIKSGISNFLIDRNRWWLRSPGYTEKTASFVLNKGKIYGFGTAVDAIDIGVRPAMWIDLSKL